MPVVVGVSFLVVIGLLGIVAFVLDLTSAFTLPTFAWQLVGAVLALLAVLVWNLTF